MTTIRDMTAPVIDGELRRPGAEVTKKSSGGRIVSLLCISAMAVTVMNLATAIYLYRANGEISAIGTQLEKLAEFEKRMKERLDLVNTGLQSQFDHLNRDMQGRFSEIYAGISRFERRLDTIEVVETDAQGSVGGGDTAYEDASLISQAEIEPTSEPATALGVAALSPRKRSAKRAAAASPAYQRSETADGKVYYRKVQ
jgi:hypothetical protein